MLSFFIIQVFLGLMGLGLGYPQNGLPKSKNGNTYFTAHRGAHNGIPENYLAAYQKAIELGCDFVEIYIRTTKDGKLVSVHNATIDAYVMAEKGKVKENQEDLNFSYWSSFHPFFYKPINKLTKCSNIFIYTSFL